MILYGMHVCLPACVRAYVYVHTSMYVYVCLYVCVCDYMCVSVSQHVCVIMRV